MVVKREEKYEKTRNIKNNDKSKKYILRGQRNTRYHEKILSNNKKSYITIFFLIQYNCILSQLSSVQKSIWHQSQRIASSSDTNHLPKSQKYKS